MAGGDLMKQGTTALVAAAILLAGTSALIAQPLPPGPVYYETRAYHGGHVAPPYAYAPEDEVMPAYEVAAIMRSRGFLPLGGPVQRGGFYVVAAAHPRGGDGRLVIDAYSGRIVRFMPARDVIHPSRNDEMVLVYQGPTFPPPDRMRTASRFGAPPVPERGAPRPPASVPRVVSRVPPEAPLAPKPRPQAAPQRPDTAQAPPVPAPVETKPAAPSPPLAQKPLEKTPDKPVVQPTQPLPPVQTME
jgi:hypothetical protein